MIAPADSPHTIRPLEGLLNLGCEVVFLAARDPFGPLVNGYTYQKVRSWRGKYTLKRLSPTLCRMVEYWLEVLPMKRMWKRLKVDLVHVSWVNEQAARCVEEGMRPLVLTIWGSDINDLFAVGADPKYRARIGRALAQADLVLVDSSDMIEKCTLLAGAPIKIKLQMVGIDTQLFRPGYAEEAETWKRALGIARDCKVLLSVRALAAHYGQRDILHAYAAALPKITGATVLVINRHNGSLDGAPSPYEMELRALAAQLGISDHVRWMDSVPTSLLPAVYAAAELVVNYPSKDAFPVTFLEAAACERPVLSCLLPAYEDTFAAKCFIMLRHRRLSDLSEALVAQMNATKILPDDLLAQARRQVVLQYDKSITSVRLLAHYKEVLSKVRS